MVVERILGLQGKFLSKIARFVNPGIEGHSVLYAKSGILVFSLLLAVSTILALFVAWALYKTAIERRKAPDHLRLWIVVSTLLPLYLVAPGTAFGISDPGSKILQIALALGLILSIQKLGIVALPIASCSFVLSLSAIMLFAANDKATLPPCKTAQLKPHFEDFGHAHNHSQDRFYFALQQNDLTLRVFPTGMFLDLKGR